MIATFDIKPSASTVAVSNMSPNPTYPDELAIDSSTLFSIYNDGWKFGIYTTSSKPQYDNYANLTYNNTILRVSYHRYGLAGDATTF